MRIASDKKSVDFFLALRCTTRKYAKDFVEKGAIKFSTPQSWVAYEEKNNKGRGDVLEGTFACCNLFDLENLTQIADKYKISEDRNIEKYIKDGKIYFKRKSVMNLPVFCVYLLKADAFEWPEKAGWHSIGTTIPAKYFRDFADHQTPEEINGLPLDKQPAVVVIRDFDTLKRRIITHLLSLGINEDEILIEPISYYDFNQYGEMGWFDLCQKPPLELAFKDISFSAQSEARFIINTKNEAVTEYLRNNVIHIGPLSDIASIAEGYFSEGLEFSCKVELAEYDDTEK